MKTLGLSPELYNYMLSCCPEEHRALADLRAETAKQPYALMQIPLEQGSLLGVLAQLTNAKRYLEVGVFTGYSSLAMALAMPNDGRIVACDVSEEYTNIARKYWERAGVAYKVDLRLGPALKTLDAMLAKGEAGTFDMAFIDADKVNQDVYYERCLQLVRRGGLVLIDNAFFHGAVLDPQDEDVKAIDALNKKVSRDSRVRMCTASVADGLIMAVKH